MGVTTADERVAATSAKSVSNVRQTIRFCLHLAAVYLIVNSTTMWLAGRVRDTVLPLIQQHPPTESSFQFVFSHLFVFSFFPALLVAFAYAQWYPHRIALFIWVVPLAILVLKFCTFPTTVFENHFAAAFHEYFGGGFLIAEFRNYRELFQSWSNPDMRRGMQQLNFTAPFYAAIGYSVGAWLGMHWNIPSLTAGWRKLKPTSPLSE